MPARSMRAIGVIAAVVAGAGAAAQSKVNGELGQHLKDGFVAALISFLCGLVVIAVIAASQPAARRGLTRVRSAVRAGEIKGWQCLGGACGALLVASQGLTVATLGVALFTVAVVAGQSVASLAVDRVGLGPAGPQALTGRRIVGAVLTVVAVVIAVANRLGAPSTLALAILPTIAGAGSAVQQAINGRVRATAESVTTATLINFIVGTTALALGVAIDLAIRGLPSGSLPPSPWLYTGGALGVIFIAIAAAVVHHTGVLLLSLSTIAGQLIGSIVIDIVAPGGAGRPPINTLIGVALTLLAVGIAADRARQLGTPQKPSPSQKRAIL